jgi:carbamoyltransferase
MTHWGITALNHGSSLAVIKGDSLVWTCSDKDDLPSELINNALDYQGAPDRIYWYEKPWLKKTRQLYAGQYKTAFDMSVLPSVNLAKWGLGYAPVTYTAHHASHAAAGYYTSPFDECAVVVLDAIGEWESATIWHCKDNQMHKVWSKRYPHSLGLFYSAFTQLVGLEPIKQEHMLQQMAALGDASRYYNIVKTYMEFIMHTPKNLHRGVTDWPFELTTLQDQCDVAAAVQAIFEEQINMLMKSAKGLTGSENLVYMGGCAMNTKANKIVEQNWDRIWSLPNPGDASSSIGAVLYHTKQRIRHNWDSVKHIEITK